MKKMGKIFVILVISLIALVLLFIGGVYVTNKVSESQERKMIQANGELVEVGELAMNIQLTGTGTETVVLLPGYLTGSPIIDFTQLTAELAKHYQVAVVEPFGYGLSDVTTAERTLEQISQELHSALAALKIERYTLMGHSIAGIYTLDYINRYPEEVTAFVGIDSSVPHQPGGEDSQGESLKVLGKSGMYRFLSKIMPELIAYPAVEPELKEQFRMISLKNMGNASNVSESINMKANFQAAQKLSYPQGLPVLFLLASGSESETEGWLSLHQDMLTNVTKGRIEVLEGDHYLHHTQSPAIAKLYQAFMK